MVLQRVVRTPKTMVVRDVEIWTISLQSYHPLCLSLGPQSRPLRDRNSDTEGDVDEVEVHSFLFRIPVENSSSFDFWSSFSVSSCRLNPSSTSVSTHRGT